MAKTIKCPTCSQSFKGVGHHWRYNPDHRPEITEEQHEVISGMMLGDGYINEKRDNPIFEIVSTEKAYTDWFNEFMGTLSYESTPKEPPNGKIAYRIVLRAHPDMARYSNRYGGGVGRWPDEIELTPTVLTHWYVGDGCFEDTNKQKRIRVSMAAGSEHWKRVNYFFKSNGLPVPSSRNEGRTSQSAVWSKEDSKTLFEYMDDAPAGYGYKFPEGYQ